MSRFITLVLILNIAILAQYHKVIAQNPCGEIGSDCRLMTAAETKAFKERILAVNALLPIPDPARYESDGASEGSTMPFIAEASFPKPVLICRAWPAGSFPESPYNTLDFGYLLKTKEDKTSGKSKDPVDAVKAVSDIFANRIEVSAWLRPHPYLEEEYDFAETVNVEKSATFLSWDREDGQQFHMILGPRTREEAETLIVEKPAKNFAPVMSMELDISGPKDEVATLKKKINRKALEALLGAVVK